MSHMTEHVGRVVGGRYRLLAPLGSGASAEVYLADDVRLRRRVAVKILHPALAADDGFLRRFRAEARSAASLSHPNILAVFDWNGDEQPPYIVTEYLSGGSLRSMLDADHRLSPSQALLVGLSAAQALDRAHRQGFVHRDIKPANLLFGGDGRLRIADFGLARAIAEAGWTEPTGTVLGTARYSSPEQARGEPLDGRSDVYSLALVLVEAVTGVVPFSLDTTIGTLMARLERSVDVPDELGALKPVVERAGQLDPGDRPDAATLAKELIATATELPRPAPLPLVADDGGRGTPSGGNGADDQDRTIVHGAAAPVGTAGPTGRIGAIGEADPTTPQPRPVGPPPPIVPGAPGSDGVVVGAPGHPSGPLPPPPRLAPTARSDRLRQIAIGALAVAVALALGVTATLFVMQAQRPSHEVPAALIGIPKAEVTDHVGDFGWRISYEEQESDEAPGTVLSTDPAPGSSLREGGRLTVVVSAGPPMAAVPDSASLQGLTEEQATEVLAASGINLVPEFVRVPHPTVPVDRVIGLAADTPTELPQGSTVTVEVSSGPPGPTIDDVTGWEANAAAETLGAAGFDVSFRAEVNPGLTPGTVIRTEPAAGTTLPEGSQVVIVVAQGETVSVPPVIGRRLGEARDMLEAAGLVVSANGSDDSLVVGAWPWPGSQVAAGSTVELSTF
ncbi:MAG TPA: PASTA domain-containing protein [Acidimicrobiales bacterium]